MAEYRQSPVSEEHRESLALWAKGKVVDPAHSLQQGIDFLDKEGIATAVQDSIDKYFGDSSWVVIRIAGSGHLLNKVSHMYLYTIAIDGMCEIEGETLSPGSIHNFKPGEVRATKPRGEFVMKWYKGK